MSEQINPMDKFDFLLGTWKLEYKVPKSNFSDADSGEGEGEFKRVLNDRYVTFDYHSKLSGGEGAAHAIFVWDEKTKYIDTGGLKIPVHSWKQHVILLMRIHFV